MSPTPSLVFFIAIALFYLLPSLIALIRGCKVAFGGIMALNLLLGWTVLGWIGALIWAASAKTLADEKRAADDIARAIAAYTPPPVALK
jgi:phosphoglycerol transferase MdoB-like AlkP superfamily enzyme